MSTRVAPAWFRVPVLLALALVVVGGMAAPAFATEAGGGAPAGEEGRSPTIEEIGTQNEVSDQYRPEPAEAPGFTQWMVWPLVIIGVLMGLALLMAYLKHQPRFAEERRSKRRR